MREILFRGKSVERRNSGRWIEGSIVTLDDTHLFIVPRFESASTLSNDFIVSSTMEAVDSSTVGQYTGLTDKSGLTKIFEYDIIDANGRKVGNYYENSNLLKDGTCFLVARMGTKEWSRSEQEAIKRGCKYAE